MKSFKVLEVKTNKYIGVGATSIVHLKQKISDLFEISYEYNLSLSDNCIIQDEDFFQTLENLTVIKVESKRKRIREQQESYGAIKRMKVENGETVETRSNDNDADKSKETPPDPPAPGTNNSLNDNHPIENDDEENGNSELNDGKKHICHTCSPVKSFRNHRQLMRHKLVHQELNHQCQTCLQRFTSAEGLKRHSHLHDGDLDPQTRKTRCKHCSNFVENLAQHIHDSHPLDYFLADGKFYCKICKRSFGTESGVKKHLSTTTHSTPVVKAKFMNISDQVKISFRTT